MKCFKVTFRFTYRIGPEIIYVFAENYNDAECAGMNRFEIKELPISVELLGDAVVAVVD